MHLHVRITPFWLWFVNSWLRFHLSMSRLSQRYKKVFLTGGRSGLGRAFLDMLLDSGLEVWATSRNPADLPNLPKLHPLALDLRDPEGVQNTVASLIQEVPDIDLVINNAGYGVFSPVEALPKEHIQGQLQVLLESPMLISQAFYKQMITRGAQGCFVHVSSLAAQFPIPWMSLYNASKAGLATFSRSLALEAKGHGIAVIDFQPGDFQTDFNEAMLRFDSGDTRATDLWATLEDNLSQGPRPAYAAKVLKKALLKQRSGLICAGSPFQAKIAPFLARFASNQLLDRCLRWYFNLPNK
tara:strand:- start:899 stop:1792 length:894 start_codon:yes stop_codon:yes gene_type:complete